MTKAILSHASRPANSTGGRFILWARKNLFSSWSNSLLTIVCLWLMWELIPPLLNWAFLQANWVGSTRADCTKAGACWVCSPFRFSLLCRIESARPLGLRGTFLRISTGEWAPLPRAFTGNRRYLGAVRSFLHLRGDLERMCTRAA